MFSHLVLVCQLLDVSYGLQLSQAVGGVQIGIKLKKIWKIL
jgi:hypothetical protein